MLGVTRDVRPRGDDFEAHDLEGIEDQPRGQRELCLLVPVVMCLWLVLHFLGQHSHLVVAESLHRAPILDRILADKNVGHSALTKMVRLLHLVDVIVIVQ